MLCFVVLSSCGACDFFLSLQFTNHSFLVWPLRYFFLQFTNHFFSLKIISFCWLAWFRLPLVLLVVSGDYGCGGAVVVWWETRTWSLRSSYALHLPSKGFFLLFLSAPLTFFFLLSSLHSTITSVLSPSRLLLLSYSFPFFLFLRCFPCRFLVVMVLLSTLA